MRITTLLKNYNVNKFVDIETISKLLLCYYNNIHDNLLKINEFEIKENLNYVNDYINLTYAQKAIKNKNGEDILIHNDLNLNKHKILMDLFVNHINSSFLQITNYKLPSGLNLNNIIGPYIKSNYIIFYNVQKEIMIVFNYIPIRYLDHNTNNIKDLIVRDLNSYIIDNVNYDIFEKYVMKKTTTLLDFETEILSHNTISFKLSESNNTLKIMKLIKETINTFKPNNSESRHPFYKWELITKELNQN